MIKLKCYFGESIVDECIDFNYMSLCFAQNGKEAKKLMWKQSMDFVDACDGRYINARAVRKKEFDVNVDRTKTEAYIPRDSKTLRDCMFMWEGDDLCDTCGKASMNDEYPVCSECNQCIECGCTCGKGEE